MKSGYAGNGNTGMGNGYQGKWGNNNVGSNGNMGNNNGNNGKVYMGNGNTGNNLNTGNYYTNKWCYKNNNGNTVTTGNPTNTSNGINTTITGPWPKSGKKEETVFVSINQTIYYEYTVTNLNGQI